MGFATMVSFEVPGEATPKMAPKFVRATGHTHKPTKEIHAAAVVKQFAVDAMTNAGVFMLDGPVAVSIAVFRGRGRPSSKKGREQAEKGLIRPVTRPDVDNVAKLVLDAMNGIAYRDDSQVVSLTVDKWFSERPRIEITVREWTP